MPQQEEQAERCINDLRNKLTKESFDQAMEMLQQAGSMDYEGLFALHKQILNEESGNPDDNPYFFENLLVGDSELCCLQISEDRKFKGTYKLNVIGFAAIPRSILNYIL